MKKSFLLGLAAMLLPLASWAQETSAKTKLEPAFTNTSTVTYAGDNTKGNLGITLKDGATTLNEGSDYYLGFEVGGSPVDELRNVGIYTVKVNWMKPTLSDKYEVDDFTVIVTSLDVSNTGIVTPKSNDAAVTLEYGDELDLDKFITVDATKLAANSDADAELDNFLKGLHIVALEQTKDEALKTGEVGTYSVAVTGLTSDNPSNYTYTRPENGYTFKLDITKKQLYIALDGKIYNTYAIVTDRIGTDKTYKLYMDEEKETAISDELNDKLTITCEYDANDNEGVKNEAGMKAGTYYLKAEINGGDEAKHYTLGDGPFEYIISKANLVIEKSTSPVLSKTYGSMDPDLTEQFTYNRKGGNNEATLVTTSDEFKALKLAMKREEGENVYNTDGKTKAAYAIYPVVDDDEDGELDNYEIVYYAGKDETAPTFSIDPLKLNKGEDTESGEASDNITFVQPTDKSVTYAGVDFVVTKPEITGLTLKTKGLAISDLNDVQLEKDKDYTLVYSATGQDDGKADEAGEKFNITILGKGNYSGGLWSLGYTIKKAELTITPLEDAVFSKVFDDSNSGNLNKNFEFIGLKEVDEEGNPNPDAVLTMKSNSKTIGKHNVDIYGLDDKMISQSKYKSEDPTEGLKNYIVTYTKVQFEILEGGLVLDGADEEGKIVKDLEAYDGLTVETVVVKNLKSRRDKGILGEKWYTLVLPFDITVRELSPLFGYAIVNVPNTNNDDPDVISFRLTMGEVKANTLMAFKVDEDMDWEEIEDKIVFENKTICAPTESSWATDLAGNQFIGVYEVTETENTGLDYWIHTDGSFWNGVETIYPLSGYVHYNEMPAAPRLSLENPDGSTTVINAISVDAAKTAEGWYTVGGVKLNAQPTQKGVYINNGKKVVIK